MLFRSCNECAYHHGQVIMSNTVIGMAQKYVGTNNINLFVPKGIFGSRREVRYISVVCLFLFQYVFVCSTIANN